MQSLPAKFAIRHSAVPVEVGEGFVRVVLRDPSNLRILDELFFVTGKKIVPAAAPEVRIYQALEKCYGERRTPRFAILAEKLSRPIAPSVIKKPLPPPPDFSTERVPMPGEPVAEPSAADDAPPVPPAWTVADLPPVGWANQPAPPSEGSEDDLEAIPWEELPGAALRTGRAGGPRSARASAAPFPGGERRAPLTRRPLPSPACPPPPTSARCSQRETAMACSTRPSGPCAAASRGARYSPRAPRA